MSKDQSTTSSIQEWSKIANEFCRRPSTLIMFGLLSLAALLFMWGARPTSTTASSDELSEAQLEADFQVLGALGVRESANPNAGGVQARFDFGDDEGTAPVPIFSDESEFLQRATAHSATLDAQSGPPFGGLQLDGPQSDSPRYGQVLPIPDTDQTSVIQQVEFRQPAPSYSTVPGARVTANQAAWLTGSIEAQ
jgi:hypothetical protein